MTLLTVENLKISFHTRNGTIRAVDDVSFQVEAGTTLGIVGESGSGKSVCCYSLLGLVPIPPGKIEQGQAWFNSELDLLSCTATQLRHIRGHRIAMVFQDPMTSLNPYLTIGRQLTETMRSEISKSERRTRAIQALTEVGIPQPEQRLHSYPHEFSGGMRQRVMIAMALINEPDLLIADEPTTALDVTVQAQILDLLRNLQQRYNMAMILISHDLNVVAANAQYVLVMQAGKVVETGEPSRLFSQPTHPYTRKLINAMPQQQKTVATTIGTKPLLEIQKLKTWFTQPLPGLFKTGKHYTKAVDDISLTLYQGEIVGLVGESGSGKSTLGRSIMRLLTPNAGDILLHGQSLVRCSTTALRQQRRHLQMIFQDPYASLNPRMTVYDILAEALNLQQIPRNELTDRIHSLLDEVGLERTMVRRYPHEFSGGQRQRIAIARAIAPKPELIIADEPVSALDITIQAQILKLLLKLTQQYQLTLLFISHDLAVVRYLCDRVAVMYQGKIVELADTTQLFTKPSHPYTQKLLASIPGTLFSNLEIG